MENKNFDFFSAFVSRPRKHDDSIYRFGSAARRNAVILQSLIRRGSRWLLPLLLSGGLQAVHSQMAFTTSGSYTVPAGVTQLTATVSGGGGGNGGDDNVLGGVGGKGAMVSGVLTVTPGEVLTLTVGTAGTNGIAAAGCGGAGAGGSGWQSGGAGANAGCKGTSGGGGGGGGASAILSGTKALMAAGGGGGANGASMNITGMSGGDASVRLDGPGAPGAAGQQVSSPSTMDGSGGGGGGGGCTGGRGGAGYQDLVAQKTGSTGGTSCAGSQVTSLVFSTPVAAGTNGSITLALMAPEVAMGFLPALVEPSDVSTLTITLTNRASLLTAITGVTLVDNYPAGLVNSTLSSPVTTCTGGTVSLPSSGSVKLVGGSIPGGGSCTVVVQVTAAAAGRYTNTVAAGGVSSANALPNTASASAVLEVRTGVHVLPTPDTVDCKTSAFVFNTAYASDTSAKAPGLFDNHWIVGLGAAGGPATVARWLPASVAARNPSWVVSRFSNAEWITMSEPLTAFDNEVYYRYDFILGSDVDPSTFELGLDFNADDIARSVYVNGGFATALPSNSFQPGKEASVVIKQGWKTGSNSLVINVWDVGNPTGFLAQARVKSICAKPKLTIRAQSNGATGAFAYSGNNGFAKTSISVPVANNPTAAPAQTLSDYRVATTITQSAPPPGFTLTDISCTGLGTGGSATPHIQPGADSTVLLNAAAVSNNANIVCTFSNVFDLSIIGQVFSDDGAGGGIANDGVVNGSESGLSGIPMALNDCGNTQYASGTTDGSGHYRLAVPASLAAGASLCVESTRVESRTSTGASIGSAALATPLTIAGVAYRYIPGTSADRIAFAWPGVAGLGSSSLNFASVPSSSLSQGGLKVGMPGSTVVHAHAFSAGTAGKVSFSVDGPAAPPTSAGWTTHVFEDPGCTGKLQPGAAILYPPAVEQNVVQAQKVCLVLRQSIPVNAQVSDRHTSRLQAAFALTNAVPALSASYAADDVATVTEEALALLKEVRNVTQAVRTFGVSNQARPGDILEYRISYTNVGPAPLRTLAIHASTPAFTSFLSAESPGPLPSALTDCLKTTPASSVPAKCSEVQASGGRGTLSWTFSGALDPGASGSVLYRVSVD